APRPDTVPVQVINESAAIQSTSRPVELTARVVDLAPPTAVRVAVRAVGSGVYRWLPMRPVSAYEYRVVFPTDSLRDGRYEYSIVVSTGDSVTTFPTGEHTRPGDWDFRGDTFWPLAVVTPSTARPRGARAAAPHARRARRHELERRHCHGLVVGRPHAATRQLAARAGRAAPSRLSR